MRDQLVERLLDRQAFMHVDHDGHVAQDQRRAGVGTLVRLYDSAPIGTISTRR